MNKFIISYPITPMHINQQFGVNGEYYRANGIDIKGHNGVDLQAYHGQPVYAAHDGVAYWETDEQQGHGVIVRTNDLFDYNGQDVFFKSVYWHFCDPVKEPKYKSPVPTDGSPLAVKKGDLVGFADSTGFSGGDHLHFSIKPIISSVTTSPEDATDVGIGQFRNLLQLNGYGGAIDPIPYFDGKFAGDKEEAPQPSISVNILAGQKVAENNVSLANILYSIGNFIKVWWNK